MSEANPFLPEEQAAAAARGEWGGRKRDRRRRALSGELAELAPKLESAETDMRRAARIARELHKLIMENDPT